MKGRPRNGNEIVCDPIESLSLRRLIHVQRSDKCQAESLNPIVMSKLAQATLISHGQKQPVISDTGIDPSEQSVSFGLVFLVQTPLFFT